MGAVRIREEPPEGLEPYDQVGIGFLVTHRMDVLATCDEHDPWRLEPRPVPRPWIKDYDVAAGPPSRLEHRGNVANWGVFAAFEADRRVGGALVAWQTPGLEMLEGRDDLAVLWDLRVAAEHRGRGIGTRLFEAACAWARRRGGSELRVETQDVNVPACRFYAARGCRLLQVMPGAYQALPGETKLVWGLPLVQR